MCRRPRRKVKSAGAALILAMMIAAAMTVLVSSLLLSQQVSLRRTANIINGDQALEFSLAAEQLGMILLQRDRKDGETDHLGEEWALFSVTGMDIPIPGFEHLKEDLRPTVNVRITELNSRFNLNNLVDSKGNVSKKDMEMFKRLLRTLGLSEQENIANAIVDWIDTNVDISFPDGAEDGDYLGMAVPYRPANQMFVSPTELYLVKGMTPEIYDKLAPFITVLPKRSKINVNTAPAEILTMLHDDLKLSDAQEIVKERQENFKENGFTKLDDFAKLSAVDELSKKDKELAALLNDSFSVSSDFFLIASVAQYGEGRMQLYSEVSRDDKTTRVIYRGQGSY